MKFITIIIQILYNKLNTVKMEIEITMQNNTPVQEHTPVVQNTATPVIENIPNNLVINEETTINQETVKGRKELSAEDINIIIINTIDKVCAYLTEHTEFEHMKDKIINRRMRDLMQEKFYRAIERNIYDFITFLNENKLVLEYYEQNKKIMYSVNNYDDFHQLIYEEVYESVNAIDIAYGWMNWDSNNYCVIDNDNFGPELQDFMVNLIIKNVFESYGDEYEFIENRIHSENSEELDVNEEENEDTEEEEIASDTKKDDCIIV